MMEAMFDLLRAKVEAEIPQPGVLAITSATNKDASDIAARTLAECLAATGYSTLLVDVTNKSKPALRPAEGFPQDEIGRRVIAADSTAKFTFVTIGESVQRTTNQRHIRVAFESFREKFDYTVISAGSRVASNPFAASIVGVAKTVIVSVRLDRRQARDDFRLAANLGRLGPRFLGLISMTKATIDTAYAPLYLETGDKPQAWRAPMPPMEETIGRH